VVPLVVLVVLVVVLVLASKKRVDKEKQL